MISDFGMKALLGALDGYTHWCFTIGFNESLRRVY